MCGSLGLLWLWWVLTCTGGFGVGLVIPLASAGAAGSALALVSALVSYSACSGWGVWGDDSVEWGDVGVCFNFKGG